MQAEHLNFDIDLVVSDKDAAALLENSIEVWSKRVKQLRQRPHCLFFQAGTAATVRGADKKVLVFHATNTKHVSISVPPTSQLHALLIFVELYGPSPDGLLTHLSIAAPQAAAAAPRKRGPRASRKRMSATSSTKSFITLSLSTSARHPAWTQSEGWAALSGKMQRAATRAIAQHLARTQSRGGSISIHEQLRMTAGAAPHVASGDASQASAVIAGIASSHAATTRSTSDNPDAKHNTNADSSTDAAASAAAVSVAQLLDELRPTEWLDAATAPAGCERLKTYQRKALSWMQWRESKLDQTVPNAAWKAERGASFGLRAPALLGEVHHEAAGQLRVWRETLTNALCVVGPGAKSAPPTSYDVAGGILADEMGLGKTAEVIAHIRRCPPPHTSAISEAVTGSAMYGGKDLWPATDPLVIFASQQSGRLRLAQPLPTDGPTAVRDPYGISVGGRLAYYDAALLEGDEATQGRYPIVALSGAVASASEGGAASGVHTASNTTSTTQHVARHFARVAHFISGELGKDATAPHVDMALENRELSLLRSSASLVCLPPRLVHQWLGELRTWGGGAGIVIVHSHPNKNTPRQVVLGRAEDAVEPPLRVYVYAGRITDQDLKRPLYFNKNARMQQLAAMASADVIVVDYTVMKRERHMKHGHSVSPLRLFGFWRGVLDEAQEVEGASVTSTAMMAGDINAVHRWCVTGTPILKNLDDLQGLFRFLCHQPLGQAEYWRDLVQPLMASESPSSADLATIRQVLAPLFWRNTKSAVEAELDLPARHVYNVSIELGAAERDWYTATAVEVRKRILSAAAEAQVPLNTPIDGMPGALRADLASLRRICCHPGLSDRMQVAAGGVLSEEVQQASRNSTRKRRRGDVWSQLDPVGGAGGGSAAALPAAVIASSPEELMHKQLTAFISDTVQPAQAKVMDMHLVMAQWHWLAALYVSQLDSVVDSAALGEAAPAWHMVQAEAHARMGWGASQHVELWREQHSIERLMYRAYAVRETRFILILLRMFFVRGREEAAAAAAERWKQTSLHTILRYAKQHIAAVRQNTENGAQFVKDRLQNILYPQLHHPGFLLDIYPAVMDAISSPIPTQDRMESAVEVEVEDAQVAGSKISTSTATLHLRLRDLLLHDASALPGPGLPNLLLAETGALEKFARHMGVFLYQLQAWVEVSELLVAVRRTESAVKAELGQGQHSAFKRLRKQLRRETKGRRSAAQAWAGYHFDGMSAPVVMSESAELGAQDVKRDSQHGVAAGIALKMLRRHTSGPKASNLNDWKATYTEQLTTAAHRCGLDASLFMEIARPHDGRGMSMPERMTAWVQKYGAYSSLGQDDGVAFMQAVRSGEMVFENERLVRGWAGRVSQLPRPPHEACLRWPFCVVGHPAMLPYLFQSDLRTDLSNLENSCGLVRDYVVTVSNAETGLLGLQTKTSDFLQEVFTEAPFQRGQALQGFVLPMGTACGRTVSAADAVAMPFCNLAADLSNALHLSNHKPIARKQPDARFAANSSTQLLAMRGWSRAAYLASGDGFAAGTAQSSSSAATVCPSDVDLTGGGETGDQSDEGRASTVAVDWKPLAPGVNRGGAPLPCPVVFQEHLWNSWTAEWGSMQQLGHDAQLAATAASMLHSQLGQGIAPNAALAVLDRETSRADTWTAAARSAARRAVKVSGASALLEDSGYATADPNAAHSDMLHTLVDQFERWDSWATPPEAWSKALREWLEDQVSLGQVSLNQVLTALHSTDVCDADDLTSNHVSTLMTIATAVAGESVSVQSFGPNTVVQLQPLLSSGATSNNGAVSVFNEDKTDHMPLNLRLLGLGLAVALHVQLVAVRAAGTKLSFLQQKADLMKSGFNCTICSRTWQWSAEPRADGENKDTPPAPALLPCGHVYCYDCLAQWANAQAQSRIRDGLPANEGSASCPECRVVTPRDQWFTFKPGRGGLGAESALAYITYQSLAASEQLPLSGTPPINPMEPSVCLVENGRIVHDVSGHGGGTAAAARLDPKAAAYTPAGVPDVNAIESRGLLARFGTKLVCILRRIQSLPVGDKVLIFTQWRSLIPLLHSMLHYGGVSTVALEGSAKSKQTAVHCFNTQAQVRVLLLCSDADASGLTLIAARHVFLVDPCDLPGTEEQCVNRVHRLGQTATCFVYRFIAESTIEELVYTQQQVARYGGGVMGSIHGTLISSSRDESDHTDTGGASAGGAATLGSPSKRRRRADASAGIDLPYPGLSGIHHLQSLSGGGAFDSGASNASLLLIPGKRKSLDAAIAAHSGRKSSSIRKRARDDSSWTPEGSGASPPAQGAAGAEGGHSALEAANVGGRQAPNKIDSWAYLVASLKAGGASAL